MRAPLHNQSLLFHELLHGGQCMSLQSIHDAFTCEMILQWFQGAFVKCRQEYALSILKQPYYEGGSKACEALVHP
jgi:hypothetical protein